MSTRCNICGRQPPGIAGHGRTAAAVFGANRRYHLAMPGTWDDGARADVNDATLMALDELPIQAKAPPFLKIAPVHHLRQFGA